MKACVLIHGAWHGAWCWERLEPYLSGDCKLVIPTLPIEDGNNGINTNVQTIIHFLI